MSMGITRLVDLSLNYYLGYRLSNEVTGEPLKRRDENTYIFKHNNLVPIVPPSVFVDGELIDFGNYQIYPVDSRVVFTTQQSSVGQVTANYRYSLINVVDAFRQDIITPPIVAIEDSGDNQRSVELGTGSKFVKVDFRIGVYARSEGQRDDITDLIKDALCEEMPIWDLNQGFPILGNGEINQSFDANNTIGLMVFDEPFVRRNPLQSMDKIELGRALITVRGEYIRWGNQ